jgi:predicted RNA binding protein YcfA (HicA-like mRNA interferase family)
MNLAPMEPAMMKRILEMSGFECIHTDARDWLMESNGLVAVIPHTMKKLPTDTVQTIVEAAQIESTFDELRNGFDIRPSAAPTPPL